MPAKSGQHNLNIELITSQIDYLASDLPYSFLNIISHFIKQINGVVKTPTQLLILHTDLKKPNRLLTM